MARAKLVPATIRARGTVRAYGANKSSTTSNIIRTRHAAAHKCISRTRRPPCSNIYTPNRKAEHRRTALATGTEDSCSSYGNLQLRAYLHQLVGLAAKLITAADRSLSGSTSANTVSVHAWTQRARGAKPPAARRKPADTGSRLTDAVDRVECGSMVPRYDLCRPACRRTGCSTAGAAVNHRRC